MKKNIRKVSEFLLLAAIPVWVIALLVDFYYAPLTTLQGILGMIGATVGTIMILAGIIGGVALWMGTPFSEFSQEEKSRYIDSFYGIPIMTIVVAFVDYWFLGWVSSLSFLLFWWIAYYRIGERKELDIEGSEREEN